MRGNERRRRRIVMEGKRFIHKLKLQNLLSFGPDGMEIELEPLNVLIGPNASGKSNLIDAISVLRAAPTDLMYPLRIGGGIDEWLWKGGSQTAPAWIDAWVQSAPETRAVLHHLVLDQAGERARLVEEAVGHSDIRHMSDGSTPYYLMVAGPGIAHIRVEQDAGSVVALEAGEDARTMREIDIADLKLDESILSQRKDPDQYPSLTQLGVQYSHIAIYREWELGRWAPARAAQPTDESAVHLEPDARNLFLVLNNLEGTLGPRSPILQWLQRVHPDAEGLHFTVFGGSIQMRLHERGLRTPIPATRLSDGTMRWLCLLAVLCHPEPPPLVCLEEPEMGLHPDAVRVLAELLVEASERMQLIVTTHSSELVAMPGPRRAGGRRRVRAGCRRDADGAAEAGAPREVA